MAITLYAQVVTRHGTAADWTAANPTLAAGELGVESDTLLQKVGDGATAWTALQYCTTVYEATAGAPADAPLAGTARFDPAAFKLYIYTGAAWKSVTLA